MLRRAILLLFLATLAVAEEDNDVIVLDEYNFAEGVADEPVMLVEFYAPWCGHCKRLAPEYEKAATALAKEDPPIPLAKVDCPDNSNLCGKYGVSGYPTLKIFRNGEMASDYTGPRTTDGIVSVMKKQSGPSSKEFDTVEAVQDFIHNKENEHTVIGFFAEADSKLQREFTKASDAMRETFRFGHTTTPEVMEAFGYKDQVVIVQPPILHTKLESAWTVYEGAPKSADIQTFVKRNFMGLAGIRTTDNGKYFEDRKPLAVVYYDIDYKLNPKGSQYWRNRVIKVAKEFSEVTFAVSSKADFGRELDDLGLDKSEDVVVGLYDKKGKYAMTGKFSVDNLKAFVQQYVDGELEVYVKSEPIPEDNDGPVKVVVGKNFDEVVNDEEKDVLVEFYAPWCGHCKSLAPKYEELGEKLKNDPNIVIAKTDATANDFPPQYEVRGFPTIYWVPAGKKDKPEKYEGSREVSDFLDYIKKKATHPPVVAGDDGEGKKKKKKAADEL